MPEEKPQSRRNAIQLLISTLLSIGASITAIFLKIGSDRVFPFFASIHWLAWVAIILVAYLLSSALIQWKKPNRPFLIKVFRVPLWSDLRAFGEQPTAKLSYWALIGIPIVVYLIHSRIISFFAPDWSLPVNLKLTYFASWFIAIALVLFNVACPKEVRRKNPFEKVRTVNLVLNNVDRASIIVESDNEEIPQDVDEALLGLRALCYSFYVFGTVTFLVILLRSAIVVFKG